MQKRKSPLQKREKRDNLKAPIPKTASESKTTNFRETDKGYLLNDAIAEASRCMQCKDPPCIEGCPIHINIPEFLQCIKDRDTKSAMMAIKETNQLPGICSRLCPHEKLCEGKCNLNKKGKAISIGRLERFASDNEDNMFIVPYKIPKSRKQQNSKKANKKVAIVGSGLAGLACASDLASRGYNIMIYEALHDLGGILRWNIPEFRLPREILNTEIENIKKKGVKFLVNHVIGKTLTINDLQDEYDAIFIGTGAGQPHLPDIPGEHLNGAITANEFLARINLMGPHKFPDYDTPINKHIKTVVVGGNDKAIDAARAAKRLGADVTIVYRSTFDDIPAKHADIDHAKKEGINFLFLTYPTRIIGNTHVKTIELIQMMPAEEENSGRKKAVPIENTEYAMECNQVIFAIGQNPGPIITKDSKLSHRRDGRIVVDGKMRTSRKNVFAGGAAISGTESPIHAIRDGKLAAKNIDEMLREE